MRANEIVCGLLGLCVSACAGASSTGVVVPTSRAEGPTVIDVVPARGKMAVLANGELRVVEGLVAGARVHVRDDGSVEVAAEIMANGVASIAQVGESFLFLDRAGDLFRGASFLGPLEHVGHVGSSEIEALPDSPGRIAVLSAMDLYTTSGELPLARAALPTGTVVDAAFRDAQHGLAKLDGGLVMTTIDGGATWRALHLEAPAVYIGATRERLGVLMEGGAVFVVNDAGDGGSVEAWPDSSSMLPEEAIEVAFAATFSGFGVDQGDESPGVTHTRLASDVVIARTEQARFLRVDPGTRAFAPILEDASTGCYLQRWGMDAAVLCVGEPEGTIVHRMRANASLERVFAMPAMERIYVSADGHAAAWRGGCPGGPSDQTCVVRETTGYSHQAIAINADQLSAPAGDWLLVSTDEYTVLHLVRLSDGVEVPAQLPEGWRARVATLAADGSLLAITATEGDAEGDAARTLFVGPAGGPLTERALPEGVRGVAFVDAQRGFAAGAHANVLARTFDGGATWESLPSPVHGDASALALVDDALVGAAIGCDAVGCRAGTDVILTMRGWGASLDVRTAHLASVARTPTLEMPALGRASLTCEATSARAPTPAAWTGRAASDVLVVTRVLAAPASGPVGTARISIGEARARVEWRGRDERGVYSVATRETELSELSAEIDPRLVYVHSASRTSIDVAVCPDGVCRMFHGRASGALVEVPNEDSSTTQTVVITSSLGSDRDVVLVAEPYGGEGAIVRTVDAGGTIAPLSRASLPGYRRHVGLAGHGAELAVIAERNGRAGFLLVPLTPDTAPRVMGGAARVAACADGPTPTDAWTATIIGGLGAAGEAGALDVVLTTDLELTADAACIRRVRLAASADPDAVPAILSAEGGALVGVGGRLDGWSEIRCTVGDAE